LLPSYQGINSDGSCCRIQHIPYALVGGWVLHIFPAVRFCTDNSDYEHGDPLIKGIALKNDFFLSDNPNLPAFAPQIEAYAALPFVYLSGTLAYYENPLNKNTTIRPEIGIGYFYIFLVYGRNFKINGNGMDYLYQDQLSIKLIVPFGESMLSHFF
jgi:hypothetical protein